MAGAALKVVSILCGECCRRRSHGDSEDPWGVRRPFLLLSSGGYWVGSDFFVGGSHIVTPIIPSMDLNGGKCVCVCMCVCVCVCVCVLPSVLMMSSLHQYDVCVWLLLLQTKFILNVVMGDGGLRLHTRSLEPLLSPMSPVTSPPCC